MQYQVTVYYDHYRGVLKDVKQSYQEACDYAQAVLESVLNPCMEIAGFTIQGDLHRDGLARVVHPVLGTECAIIIYRG